MDDYLRSEVFFNVARFPDMRFVSTSVEKRDEHLARVTGDLTMLGVTRPISLDVEVARKLEGTNQRVGFKATAVINRLDLGMTSPLPLPAHLPGGFAVPNLTGPNALIEARAKFVHEAVSKLLIAADCMSRRAKTPFCR
jgi:hypothetical protein